MKSKEKVKSAFLKLEVWFFLENWGYKCKASMKISDWSDERNSRWTSANSFYLFPVEVDRKKFCVIIFKVISFVAPFPGPLKSLQIVAFLLPAPLPSIIIVQ